MRGSSQFERAVRAGIAALTFHVCLPWVSRERCEVSVFSRGITSKMADRGKAFGSSGISLAFSRAERCPGALGTTKGRSPGGSGARFQTVFERKEVQNER